MNSCQKKFLPKNFSQEHLLTFSTLKTPIIKRLNLMRIRETQKIKICKLVNQLNSSHTNNADELTTISYNQFQTSQINQSKIYLCTCKILNPYNSKIAIAIGIIYYLANESLIRKQMVWNEVKLVLQGIEETPISPSLALNFIKTHFPSHAF